MRDQALRTNTTVDRGQEIREGTENNPVWQGANYLLSLDTFLPKDGNLDEYGRVKEVDALSYTELEKYGFGKLVQPIMDAGGYAAVSKALGVAGSQPRAPPNTVLLDARRKLVAVATRGQDAAKHALGYAFGAAGVRSNVEPCTTGLVCLNCAIADNIIDTVVEEGIRVVLFLKYTWIEITLKEFKEHIKRIGLNLVDGLTNGLKGVFSDVSMPRLPSLSIRFDMARLRLGVDVKYAVKKALEAARKAVDDAPRGCLLYTSPSPRDRTRARMPSSA